jgi:subtilisin family serine protease
MRPVCHRLDPSAGGASVRRPFVLGFGLGLALACCWPAIAATPAPVIHPHRILVMPRDGRFLPELAQDHATHGRRVLRMFPKLGGLQVVRVAEGETVAQALAACQTGGWAAWAEPDYAVSAAAVLPNDPYFQNGTQWWLNNYGQSGGLPDADLDAPEAWDVLRAASNVVVAIVDSGVRPTHEDLADNLWRNPLDGTPGFNALSGGHDPWDENGHGTHLAGVIAAIGDNTRGVAGVSWRARLMACKFLDSAGNGYNSDAIACMEFARSNGAHILNLSWGGSDFSAAVSNALWAARADGLLVVAAAGNNAANTDLVPYYPASLALDHIVAVGASTRTDDRWPLSSYGAANVDLFAPGAAIYSTASSGDAAYESRNGTSMAAAGVAGAVALMRQQWPEARADELVARLLGAVDLRPAFTGRCATGGRLNLRRVLDLPSLNVASPTLPVKLLLTGVAGHRYVVAASTNLSTWTAVETNTLGGAGIWLVEDANSTNLPWRYYRAAPGP